MYGFNFVFLYPFLSDFLWTYSFIVIFIDGLKYWQLSISSFTDLTTAIFYLQYSTVQEIQAVSNLLASQV